jgi:O-antigen ligase
VLGLGAGISPFFAGYYDNAVWLPIGLGLTLAAAAAAIVRPPRVTLPTVLAFAGIAGLGLWSLLSASWAHGVEAATVVANRWLTYAALLLLALVVARTRRQATLLLAAAGVGLAVVGATVLIRMLGSDPAALFLAGRLNAPLGYINGEGCAFAMACWFGLALAERRQPLVAGLGAGATVALACLTLLSQSRGAAIASFVAILVGLAVIPGARRRLLALAVIAAGVAVASSAVLNVYSTGQAGTVSASVAHHAAFAILASAAAAAVVWALVVGLGNAVENRGPRPAAQLSRVATGLAIVILVVPVAAALVRSASIERTVRHQWNAFVHLSDVGSSTSQTRLLSGAGNRYDYWRIAWHAFTAHPLIGVGAGNYTESYYRQRQTQEAIENPHSLELQTLSELGLVGAVLLALSLAGVAVGVLRTRLAARASPAARTTMVAATGAAVVWLLDTSGDWMHLLPGVSAVALVAAAVLCQGGEYGVAGGQRRSAIGARTGAAIRPRGSAGALLGASVVAFALAVGGASLLRAGLVSVYLSDARSELATRPANAIVDAGRALRLDGANLDAYYVKAAGEARFDQAAAARATLLSAAREDPQAFVTWTLLGDLEVRLRDFGAARTFYGRARVLDPNDPTIAALAANPASALTPGRRG